MCDLPGFRIIARIRSDFGEKFGIPRQSGMVPRLTSEVVFEPEFGSCNALRGLDGFSHIWLLWYFSENAGAKWSPTVRPPRLGGNARMGVFATRSPFRPNPIGLSCVRLDRVDTSVPNRPVLTVSGADLMDGTPILDIKPYLPFTDSRPDASCGFAQEPPVPSLEVTFSREAASALPGETLDALADVLCEDPRPAYHCDPDRVYKMNFAGFDVGFKVSGHILHVISAVRKTS